jgi:osmotically-inducible protein OsmY
MKTDAQLKRDIEAELAWERSIKAHVGVAVDEGVVTLTGHLETFTEKFAIDRVVCIADALKRRAQREARDVHVTMSGGVVTLRGQVHSIPERDAARGAALAAPGVAEVVDELTVGV